MLNHTRITRTMESIFISRFTVNNIAQNLQQCWTHKTAFKIIYICQSNQISFTVSLPHFQRTHMQSFTFLRLLFKFHDKFCSPLPDRRLLITKIGNRNLNPKSTGRFSPGTALGGGVKIRSRHPRELKLAGSIAYVLFCKICKFEIMTSLPKTMANFEPPRNQTNYISFERY